MSWYIQGVLRERFNILNAITWEKEAGWHKKSKKEELRSYTAPTETIFFCEQFNSDNIALGESGYNAECDKLRGFVFEPLRAYLDGEKCRAGLTTRQVAEAFQKKTGSRTVTGMAGHWFTPVQWVLPTEENYQWLQGVLNNDSDEYLRRDYEELRQQYEELRRPFFATDEMFTSVWHYKTVQPYEGKHLTEKPYKMLHDIIKTTTRPGALVGDFFLGSGTTAAAAQALGRQFIGGDMSAHWCEYAKRRIETLPLLVEVAKVTETQLEF